ncbi:DNA-binding helix-turn-helix protein [Leptospira broomii serovar Hurstbridge str. 5399]|uniref:DNA-binding helix-turn-helix protein n=1 Tax=Leptospira broomii serovar Hurstbridge str. 5399 TaxID=1049789 RepID=T0FC42_9LEPT|nr:AraC family transcriptional regulator [Leptospira broomii]EQA45137.1 DNA-binding helix-turn-helix protein [Leptospira broomii serovar Hurstbridge str. 5399]
MTDAKTGALFYFEGRILFANRGLVAEAHSHYAVSILISISLPFFIQTESGERKSYQAVVLAPNFHHTLLAQESDIVVVQLDPHSTDYAPIAARFGKSGIHEILHSDLNHLTDDCRKLLEGKLDCSRAKSLFEDILSAVGAEKPMKVSLDPRILSATKRMKASLPGSVSVPELAKESGFSETRFMHLFKEQLGLPVRQYQLWLRLQEAAYLLKEGGNLTEAAHAAGFADQAHLSRTFKKMFGVQPSRFLGSNSSVKVTFCV